MSKVTQQFQRVEVDEISGRDGSENIPMQDGGYVVSTTKTQTLTNKTITSPTVTNATLTDATLTDATLDGSPDISGATITTSTITSPTIDGAPAISGATITTSTITSPTIDGVPVSGVGNGAKNGASVAVTEYGDGIFHKTVLTCTATTITISDDGGVAQYGGVKVYDFPEGLICTLGAVVDGVLTAGVTGTIIDNWDGDVALGSATATTGATLIGTEADIMPSVAVSAGAADKDGVVDAVTVAAALTESGATWLDGTTTPVDLFLNFVIDDDATHTAGTAEFTGTITLLWTNIGDLS